jgi:hypothetical protein
MAAKYTITRTGPTTYLSETGGIINGFVLTVFLPDFNETHLVNVPSLVPDVVSNILNTLVDQRMALSQLGSGSE